MCAWSATLPDPPPGGEAPLRTRREALQWAAAVFLGIGLAPIGAAVAGDDDLAFAAGSLDELLSALGGRPATGPGISLTVPDFVENGAVVPVEVTSHLAGPQAIYIVSESNPYPVVARFSIPDGTEPFVSTRIKVAQSGNVTAVVRSGDQLYWASKATQVTVGGCGG